MLVSALDDIAWTLNLRGTDVHCNPVFVSYLLIESDKVSLFVDDNKLSPNSIFKTIRFLSIIIIRWKNALNHIRNIISC